MKRKQSLLPLAVSSLIAFTVHAAPVETGLVLKFDTSAMQTVVEPPEETLPLVTAWPDRSGRQNNAVAVESIDVPRFASSATPTGGAAVTFDGDGQYLDVGSSADFSSGQYTVYSVFRTTAMNQGRILNSAYLDAIPQTEGDQPNYALWGMMPGPNSTSNFRFQARGIHANETAYTFVAAGTPNDTVSPDTFFIGGGSWNATTGEVTAIVINGSGQRETGSASGADSVPADHLFTRIGAGASPNTSTHDAFFSGDIAELLVFNRILTSQEQQAVEDYLFARHFTGTGSQELAVTDDLILWLDAAMAEIEEPEPPQPTTRVTEWTDLSGNFHHAMGAPVEHQFPRLLEGVTPTGGDAVSFDGSSEFMEVWGHSDFDGPERTWYVVFRAQALNNGRLINAAYGDIAPDSGLYMTNYAAWGSFPGSNSAFRVQGRRASETGNFVSADAGTMSAGEFVIGGAMWDSSATVLTSILVDGAGQRAVVTADGADGVPTDNIFIRIGAGSGTATPNPNTYFTGEIAEILIYNRLLTEQEQLLVEEYLREKHLGDLPSSGYDQWVQAHFDPADWENEELTGPGANPSGDGISNLLKYAMALSPWETGREHLPAAMIVEDALLLTYRRAKNADGASFVVEVSPDLSEWSSGPQHVEEIDAEDRGDHELVTVMALHYPGENARGFMRLRIEPAE